jgi:GT2 family glycosyltransferase
MDNDVIAGPGWLERMHFHGTVDPKVGCVCPVSDRAAHGQQISYEGGDELASIHDFARERASSHHRKAAYKILFPSFCVLVHRDVIEAIGGFDPRFSPWGFEDDDFAFRAHLAGFRARLAYDVFIRHDSYGGERKVAHHRLLLRNWQRFAEKWIPGPTPPYGVLKALEGVRKQQWTRQELFVSLESPAGESAI